MEPTGAFQNLKFGTLNVFKRCSREREGQRSRERERDDRGERREEKGMRREDRV